MNGNLFRYHQLLSEKDRIVEIGEQECFSEELPFPSVHFDFCGSPPDLNMLFLIPECIICSASRRQFFCFFSEMFGISKVPYFFLLVRRSSSRLQI